MIALLLTLLFSGSGVTVECGGVTATYLEIPQGASVVCDPSVPMLRVIERR